MTILQLIELLKEAIIKGKALIPGYSSIILPRESITNLKNKIPQFDRYPFWVFEKNNPRPTGIKHSYDLFCYLYGEETE